MAGAEQEPHSARLAGRGISGTAAAVARHYDALDPFYRDVWGEHVHHGLWRSRRDTPAQAAEQLVDYVAAAVRLGAGADVVDVGAGYGATARYLAARCGARVTGYTVSVAQHGFAARHATVPGVEILLQDWHVNAQPDRSADVVVALESTEHMADLPLALAEMARVLRPGGRVAICAWLAADRAPAWQHRALLVPIMRTGRLVTLTTSSAYRRLLEAAGFTAVSSEDLTAAVARTWTVCLRRVGARLVTDSRYLRYALGRTSEERGFLAALCLIRAAYGCGALRYGLFVGTRGVGA